MSELILNKFNKLYKNNDFKIISNKKLYFIHVIFKNNIIYIKMNNKYIIIYSNFDIYKYIFNIMIYNSKIFLNIILSLYNKINKYLIIYIKKNNYIFFNKQMLKNEN